MVTIIEFPWELILFPTNVDSRGCLTMAQSGPQGLVPFEIKRTYWLHHLADRQMRGSHATFHTNQVIIPLAGSCDVMVSDGVAWRHVELDADSRVSDGVQGLWIKSGAWREIRNFSRDAVVLVLSDTLYEDADYCRDWTEYLARVGKGD